MSDVPTVPPPTPAQPGRSDELPPPGNTRALLRYLATNALTIMGAVAAAVFFVLLIAAVFQDVFGGGMGHPYDGLIVYIMLPSLFTAAVLFALFGMALKYREYRQILHGAPVPHPNRRRRVITVVIATLVTLAWLGLSAFGTYQAYHYTDSNKFCGLVCHQVMKPEYTAYTDSQHARVACVDCHIGPGASWFVRAKLSGMHQVYAVLTNTYHTPIKTPISNLRPAQDTCEQCHWPGRFSGSVERVHTHFASDEKNTPTSYHLLMKVGGGDVDRGIPKGAHWHVSPEWKVEYLPLDNARQDIPYVKVTFKDGRVEEYTTSAFKPEMLQQHSLRAMDCLDCHNRPSHVFRSPDLALNEAMTQGTISPSIPFVKKVAKAAMEGDPKAPYKTTTDAMAGIDKAFDEYYVKNPLPADQKDALAKAKEQTKRLFALNIFPEQGVDYRAFINNVGHFESKGCERCHDLKHKTADKSKSISKECNACHTIVGQAFTTDELKNMKYGSPEFKHPEDEVSLKKTCSSCHAINKDEEGEGKGEKGSKSEK
ncbi:MAG TPA: NapC/NirT family cytochrome c [Planctomycetota bacterium]|jgi:hypothetical protein